LPDENPPFQERHDDRPDDASRQAHQSPGRFRVVRLNQEFVICRIVGLLDWKFVKSVGSEQEAEELAKTYIEEGIDVKIEQITADPNQDGQVDVQRDVWVIPAS